jgi:flagellar FliJ protein
MLKLKEHKEKERQREHAETVQKVQEQKDKLVRIDQERGETLKHQRHSLVGSMSLAELLVCSRYLMKLKKDTLTGRELLRGLEKEADKRREKLVEASKERKIYEKLKEKQIAKFTKEVERLENKAVDETATNGFRRKSRP